MKGRQILELDQKQKYQSPGVFLFGTESCARLFQSSSRAQDKRSGLALEA